MKVFIIDGDAWRGKAHYSPSLDVVFISDKVDKHARDELKRQHFSVQIL